MNTNIKETATTAEYECIFQRYLRICNQAIEKNKDQFPSTVIFVIYLILKR